MYIWAATIQKDTISDAQVSTLFWINVALSAALAALIVASAPLVSRFYDEPRLIWITAAFGATMVTGGLTAQHIALLQRQMLFGRLAVIEICSLLAGFVAAVAAALAPRVTSALTSQAALSPAVPDAPPVCRATTSSLT